MSENKPDPTPFGRDAYEADATFDPAPSKPASSRRSRGAKGGMLRFVNFLFSLLIVGVVVFGAAIWYGASRFDAPGPLAEPKTFQVPDGASFASIVPSLEEEGIIEPQGPLRIFRMGVRAAGREGDLKRGEFRIPAGASMRQVMLELTDGTAITYRLTFPEGWTSWRMMERIAFAEDLSGPAPSIPPEGTLLPATYDFERGAERASLIGRMRDTMQRTVAEVWEQRDSDLPLKSPEELVTLASIVEKETGIASERPRVAAVFVNRLRKGMRLQTDPTVIYGIWGGRGKPDDYGGLRRSDLQRKTPYNTYLIDGLPPGPIANPGIESLKAVANPPRTDEFYFVADGTGGHVFARTLAEHNRNVAQWRKIEAERKRQAEASPEADAGGTGESDGTGN